MGVHSQIYQEEGERDLWDKLKQKFQPSSETAISCKIGILPNCAVETLTHFDKISQGESFTLVHAGSGLGRCYLPVADTPDKLKQLRDYCENHQGFLTILTSPASLKQNLEPWGYNGNALEIMRKLKDQFDTKNILSPGRFVGGI
ncbi:MAG: FAD-binding oxidoreductase [Okeania sp. SIO2D1]|nr:FAD-binding oxidoreductase [Okeania sp. SIO2D1]